MELTRAYKFRIYPDAKRQSEIESQLILSREFYNLLLEKSIKSYKDGNKRLSMALLNSFAKEIEKDKKFLRIYSQTRCEIKYRVMKAYQNFFRRCKKKKNGKNVKVGFPRFKSNDRYYSIIYPQDNGSFSIEKERLRVSKIGTMKIELHRSMEGKIKTLTIKKDASNYYAIFTTTKKDFKIPKINDSNPIGIDVGLKTFAVLSDGTKITKPNFRGKVEKHIALWQKRVARRKKGSERRQIAKDKMNKKYQIANDQTNDYLHKVTDKLIKSDYTSFAVEKLNIQDMVKNHRLAKSINYASWNKFFQLLLYKAESAGMKVVEVNPKNTTKTCNNCGNIQSMPLSKRIYYCEVCGLTEDRDINASINILRRATTIGQRGSYAQGEDVRPQQEAVFDELRTDKTHPLRDAVIA